MPSIAKRENVIAYIFLIPTFAFLVVFVFYPVISTVRNSFYEWSLLSIHEQTFVGIKQYLGLFNDPVFPKILRNIGTIFAVKVIVQVLVGLGLAAILQSIMPKSARIFRVIFFLPIVLTPIAVGMLWSFIFAPDIGLIPLFFQMIGVKKLATGWLGDFDLALYGVIIVDSWEKIPLPMILLLAAMQSIPEELYEAGKIDGANRWHLFRYITLPLLRRMLGISIVLASVDTIKLFDIVESMTRGGPGHSTQTFATYMYFIAFREYRLGRGCAIGMIVFVLCFLLTLIELRAFYKETVK